MPAQNTAVFGMFKTTSQSDKAVSRLTSAGFLDSDISVLASNIDGLLESMGIPDYKAKRYEGLMKDGGVLLWVHCDTSLEIDRADTILEQNGAEDVFSTGVTAVSTHEVDKR